MQNIKVFYNAVLQNKDRCFIITIININIFIIIIIIIIIIVIELTHSKTTGNYC